MKKVKCPNCGKETTWENNPFRPFCSKKCKLADLSKWLDEEYSLFLEEPTVEEAKTDSSS